MKDRIPSPQHVKCPQCDFKEALLFVFAKVISCPNCKYREQR